MSLQKESWAKMNDYWEIVGQARWIYITAVILVGIVTNFSGIINFGLPSWILWIIAWTAIIYNFAPSYFLKRLGKKPEENIVTIISFIQFALDLLIISALIHFGGGVESLAFIFYFFVIAASSFIYHREGVYSITFLALFLYNVVIYGNYFGYFSRFSREIFAGKELYERTGLVVINTFTVSAAIISTGFFIGYLSYLRNKKEEEAWNEKIRRLTEVKKTEEIRSKFVTVLTHQFRTPLCHIKLALAGLLEDKESLPKENSKLLLGGWAAMERLITLVDRLVKMKEIEEQKFMVHRDIIYLNDVVQGCIKSLEYSALNKKVTIKLDEKSDLGIFIFGDTRLIPLVAESLIQNAIDYGQEGSIVNILLKKEDGGYCQLSVQNEGIGIEEGDQGKVFTQFYRTDKAMRTETDKSGLSLYLANMITKKHNGRMWFESIPGKETTFFAQFPLAKENEKETEKG